MQSSQILSERELIINVKLAVSPIENHLEVSIAAIFSQDGIQEQDGVLTTQWPNAGVATKNTGATLSNFTGFLKTSLEKDILNYFKKRNDKSSE